jgi:phosphatidylserine/phosphatidylglycerophosphate/cardiolipin synthase-like enzyme
MRRKRSSDGVTVNAIAGTHVVTLGLDLASTRRKGCLGFAIQREDKTEDERYWMRGMKTFAETNPPLGPDGQASSREHPFQTFQWADYSAKPSHEYTYTVIPLYGKPAALEEGPEVKVQVSTEPELGKPHSVFFNRGSVASQEYARKFQNRAPSAMLIEEEKTAAYRWLSRGLEEALLAFIERASGSGWGLHGAVYEFRWQSVLAALKAAAARGADVSILYDGIEGGSAVEQNEIEIAAAKIKGLCQPRTSGKLMHNKFFVLTRKGKPQAVWTGSTNITESGIYAHLNCGHIIDDPKVAGEFLDYWEQLRTNPELKDECAWLGDFNPRPLDPGTKLPPMTTVFSPHSDDSVLEWYCEIAASAKEALMMSFAFGMNNLFKEVYEKEDEVLRFALMDKVSSSGTKAYVEGQEKRIQEIRNLPNVVVAIGNRIVTNSFDKWVKELGKITKDPHVPWVHTKFMLVDPLGRAPLTITGSANWSPASTSTNNENMLIVNGDKRVADIYVGEFMRLHSHYAFREAVAKGWNDDEEWKPQNLIPDPSWQDEYFDEGNARYWKRRYFAQTA